MFRVAIIGVGRGGEGIGGHSIGYIHGRSYKAHGGCEIVGVADISEENLTRFAEEYGVPGRYADYREMLAREKPDVVSVCTYAGLHRPMVEACAEAGVCGVWCEKPFALTMDDAVAMVEACERAGTKMAIDHQRRYLHLFAEAKRLFREGAVGAPVQIFAHVGPPDMMEWGTHWLDMIRFFMDDLPVRWVMGQVRCTGGRRAYGHLQEDHGLAYFGFADGTRGILESLEPVNGGFALRLMGTDGYIDCMQDGGLRVLNGEGWRNVPVRSNLHMPLPGHEAEDGWLAALKAFLAWVDGGPEPEITARNGLASTELYLAAYESAKRRDRIDLPLTRQGEPPLEAIAPRRE